MELGIALLALLIVGVLAFILAPLRHSEEELKPLHRPRPGTRNIRGPTEEQLAERTGAWMRRCPSCGEAVDEEFDYCGECVTPLR